MFLDLEKLKRLHVVLVLELLDELRACVVLQNGVDDFVRRCRLSHRAKVICGPCRCVRSSVFSVLIKSSIATCILSVLTELSIVTHILQNVVSLF